MERAAIGEWILSEHTRWLLWLPVALAAGVVLYFSWEAMPDYTGAALLAAGLPALRFWRRWPWVRVILAALGLMGVGIIAIQWQQARLWQPLLQDSTPILTYSGYLERVSVEDGKQKLVLSEVETEGRRRSERFPRRIRLSLRPPDERLHPGQRIQLRGGLFPLPEPALPGGFDFSRHFYFQEIGAVGFGLAPVEILAVQEEVGWRIALSQWRERVMQRLQALMGEDFSEPVVSIAIALITGERAGIPEDTKEVMRSAGLAHMLAISGLHLGLVTGILFILLRYLFVAIPRAALLYPVKKWAALGALLGGLGYLALADFPVSAQRAYVMVALVLAAVMLDRQVLSMRSLALAAVIVLLIMPSSVMGPSFQLSFAATMGIIALYEYYRQRRQKRGQLDEPMLAQMGWRHRVWVYVLGVLGTTLIASIITAPFTIYHFNQFTRYHLLANLLASPVFTFIVMPSAVIGMILLPVEAAWPAFWAMGMGVETVLAIAEWVAAFPGAMRYVPSPPGWAVGLFALGACWLCFWQQWPRHLGWGVMAVALMPFFTTATPQVIISPKAEQIAIQLSDGRYAMWRGSRRNFTAGLWLESLGQQAFAPAEALQQEPGFRCDASGCLWQRPEGLVIALPRWRSAAREDCRIADITITPFYFDCPREQAVTLMRPDHAAKLSLSAAGVNIEYAAPFSRRVAASPPGE